MAIRYCKLCDRNVKAKRKFGIGTLIGILFTGFFWIIILPFYRKRCSICLSTALLPAKNEYTSTYTSSRSYSNGDKREQTVIVDKETDNGTIASFFSRSDSSHHRDPDLEKQHKDLINKVHKMTDENFNSMFNSQMKSHSNFSTADELNKLYELKSKGVITQQEFNEQKARILAR